MTQAIKSPSANIPTGSTHSGEGVGGRRLASMIFRRAHPSTPLSCAALRGPRGACGERISQAHSVFLPRSFLPLLLLEPSYPPFPAALLSPPSGCPSLAPKVASSLPPCPCRVQERRHKFSKQTTPKGPAQPRLVPGVQPGPPTHRRGA